MKISLSQFFYCADKSNNSAQSGQRDYKPLPLVVTSPHRHVHSFRHHHHLSSHRRMMTMTTTSATASALTTHFSQTSSSMAAKAEAAVARFFATNLCRPRAPSSSLCCRLCLPYETWMHCHHAQTRTPHRRRHHQLRSLSPRPSCCCTWVDRGWSTSKVPGRCKDSTRTGHAPACFPSH